MLSPLCNESPPWSHVEVRNVHRLLQSQGGACVCILVCLKDIGNKALKGTPPGHSGTATATAQAL